MSGGQKGKKGRIKKDIVGEDRYVGVGKEEWMQSETESVLGGGWFGGEKATKVVCQAAGT